MGIKLNNRIIDHPINGTDIWASVEAAIHADQTGADSIRLMRISREDKGCNYTKPGKYAVEWLRYEGCNSYQGQGVIELV